MTVYVVQFTQDTNDLWWWTLIGDDELLQVSPEGHEDGRDALDEALKRCPAQAEFRFPDD